MTDIATDLLGKRVTVRRYTQDSSPLNGYWENYSGLVRGVAMSGESFHLLIETVSGDKGSRRAPSRLFVADVSHDEVHVVPNECGATDRIGSVCKLEFGHSGPHAVGHSITWERDCRQDKIEPGDIRHLSNKVWLCPASSRECLIRQQCTNKCGRHDPKP